MQEYLSHTPPSPPEVPDTLDVILHHISLLDQVTDLPGLRAVLPGLLESIGSYTHSDRCYLFDSENNYPLTFRMAQEWCARDIASTWDTMGHVFAEKMPNLMAHFQRGDSVLFQDWRTAEESMPEEYAYFSGQGLRSLMVFPIFSAQTLVGFIGLANPDPGSAALSTRLLRSIGGHLGSIKRNFTMMADLEKNQKQLEQSLQALTYEHSLQDALCADYDAVYYVDLKLDQMHAIRLDPRTNFIVSARLVQKHAPQNQRDSYSYRLKYYFEHYGIPESAPDFLYRLSTPVLLETLKHQDRVILRYRVTPNSAGHQHFEVQVAPLKNALPWQILLGFRHIDEIVEEQDRQKTLLENALAEAKVNNEIISAISKLYWLIYRIDLETDTFEEITAGEEVHRFTGYRGSTSQRFLEACKQTVAPEYQKSMLAFLDMTTLADRLKDTDDIDTEYQAVSGNWHTARFIVKKRDEQRRAIRALYVVRKITEEKLEQLRIQQALRAAAEDARQANIAKTEFLRRISHDIRTPINGIQGYLNIANRYPDDIERQQQCRTKMEAPLGFLLDLVNNILDLSKMESGEILLEEKPFRMSQLLSELDTIMTAQACERNILYTSQNEASPVDHLIGSPLHFNQILLNLAGNAVKYGRPGGFVQVSSHLVSRTQDTATYEFICRDNGIGMSDEFQTRLFEPFTQELSDARTQYQGSGLGLSIVKKLVEVMNGTIHFSSHQGQGTTFYVVLPFRIDTSEHSQPTSQPERMDLSGLKCLLVEDNELNMEIGEFLLTERGISVEKAWNGLQAVERFRRSEVHHYDFLLMDEMMPMLSGTQATRQIRSMPRPDAATVPIIAMSANAFADDVQRSLAAGINAHLPKPIQEQTLVETIYRLTK